MQKNPAYPPYFWRSHNINIHFTNKTLPKLTGFWEKLKYLCDFRLEAQQTPKMKNRKSNLVLQKSRFQKKPSSKTSARA
jgi:hypothetical protein